ERDANRKKGIRALAPGPAAVRSGGPPRLSPPLRPERPLHLAHLLERSGADYRIGEIEPIERLDESARDHKPREPFVVGRHDVPGRMRPAGGANHVLVGGHVLRPELAI